MIGIAIKIAISYSSDRLNFEKYVA